MTLKVFLAAGLLVLIGLWGTGSEDLRLVLIYLVPYAVAAALPLKFTDFASGLVLGAALIELPVTVLFSFFGGFFPDPRAFPLMRVTSVILAVLAIMGVAAHRKGQKKTGSFIGGALASLAYILIVVLVLSSSTSHSAELQPDPTATLGSIHACLVRYAEQNRGKYPPSLSDLGPHGLQCLDDWLAKGYAGNMKIIYHPAPEHGPRNFSLLMKRNSWFQKSNSFYTDQSGIIHESFTSQPASAADRVINNASSVLRSLANCLIQEGAPYPRDIQHFREDPKSSCSRSYMENGLRYRIPGIEVKYAPKLDHDLVKGFTLTARPRSYGKNGVRSYFVDETGVVRGTGEDREAGPDDPAVPDCEYNFNPCGSS